MKIASWNVNGIRAVMRKELLFPTLDSLQADIFFLQETKARGEQVPDQTTIQAQYPAVYFHHPVEKAGYSGTAVFSKKAPVEVMYGMQNSLFDQEGRVITLRFPELTVSNIYFPNGGQGPDRLSFKLAFYDHFLTFIDSFRKSTPVVWGGDVNTAHEEIDLARPKENATTTGFLPEERAWIDEIIRDGWVDSFRYMHPHAKEKYTYWDMKTRARERNVGWRIDYLFLTPDIAQKLKKACIHSDFHGSDHCPVSIEW